MDPKTVQFRRGTTDQHSRFAGAEGEVTIDTDKWTAVVHDGRTNGGFPVRLESTEFIRVRYLMFRAAITQGGSAVLAFSASTNAPIAVPIIEGDVITGAAAFSYGIAQAVQDHFVLPADWVPPLNVEIMWRLDPTQAVIGNVSWEMQTCGVPADGVLSNSMRFNPPQITIDSGSGIPGELITTTIENLDATGLTPEGEVFFRLTRSPTDTLLDDAQLLALRFLISTQGK